MPFREVSNYASAYLNHLIITMMFVFRKGILLSILLALCFSFTSCDSGGSDDSTLDWVGEWEVDTYVITEDGETTTTTPDQPTFWSLSENEYRIVEDQRESDFQDEPCTLYVHEIIDTDGEIVTIEGATENVNSEMVEFRLEVSEGSLTATILDSDVEEVIGEKANLSGVGDIPVPQDENNCRTDFN